MRNKKLIFLIAIFYSLSIHGQSLMPDSIITYYFNDLITNSESDSLKQWRTTYQIENLNNSTFLDKWDSDANEWVRNTREDQRYNSDGHLVLHGTYLWNPTINDWEYENEREYTFDEQGNLTLQTVTEAWVDYRCCQPHRKEYIYDENGTNVLALRSDWDSSTNDWIAYWKKEAIFNENVLTDTYYNWDAFIQDWVIEFRDSTTYDENDNRVSLLRYLWSQGEWIPALLRNWDNNENGDVVQDISSYWNEESEEWELNYKEDFNYNEVGQIKSRYNLWWNNLLNEWVFSYRILYQYDSDGNETRNIFYTWNTETNRWVKRTRFENEYDLFGNHIYWGRYEWNTNVWVGRWKWEKTFHTNIYLLQNQPVFGESFSWDRELAGWELNTKTYYYYYSFDGILSIEDNNPIVDDKNQLRVYPNPAQGFVHIEWEHFNSAIVSDLAGRRYFESNSETLDLRQLNAGVYIVTLVGKNSERVTLRIKKISD